MRKAGEGVPYRPPLSVLLGAALLYAAFFFYLCAFRLTPSPPSRGAVAVLAFFAFFLGLAHFSMAALVAGALARLPGLRRLPVVLDAWIALGMSAIYSWLALSLSKFALARAHLRLADLWFVFGNLSQLGSEGSPQERGLLLATVLGPLVLAVAIFAVLLHRRLRSASGSATAAPAAAALRSLLLLLLVAIVALWALNARYPYARYLAGTIAPETSWMARRGAGDTALAAQSLPASYSPDPSRSDRIGHGGPAAPTSGAARDNVVVLMLESVPWSRLFGPLARPEATPRMNALAAESIVFARAYATATHSDYAQTSILAALHPRKFPRHDYFVDLAYPRTLIWDLLRPAGYRTAMFSTQNEGWGNMQAFLRTPGLELFRHSPDWPEAPRRGEGAESKVFESTPVAAFASWLDDARNAPFLAYLNFQATHYPYVIPPGTRPLYEPEAIDFPTTFLAYPLEKLPVMENRFYNALHVVDTAVGEVIDALKSAGVWERTVLLVVSDHGEAFYEHGMPTHGTMLLEEQVRTAALLRIPGPPAQETSAGSAGSAGSAAGAVSATGALAAGPRVVTEPVSVLDLVPAVAAHLGLPPHGNFQGRSDILDPGYSARGRPFLLTIQGITHEDGLLLDDKKLIVNYDRRDVMLFDLALDPGESTSLAVTEPAVRADLERRLDQLLGSQLAYYAGRGWESGWYPPKLP